MNKILCILGPTAVGKTEMAFKLAKEFQAEIINADSRQVYKEMKIGTAKPAESDLNQIPSHLFSFRNLNQKWDASQFQKKADDIVEQISSRSKLPIVVGGTGLYIKALLFGFFEGPVIDPKVRKNLENELKTSSGLSKLYAELEDVDYEASCKIHPNDSIRIIRALEVYRQTGKTMSSFQKEHAFRNPRYDYLKIGLKRDRAELYDAINKRVDHMLEEGLESEVKALFEKYSLEHSLLSKSIGYQEWITYFNSSQTKEEVINKIKQNTRHFAKRQLTWFRNENDIEWFDWNDFRSIKKRVEGFL